MADTANFIPQKGFYRNLKAYSVAEIIYDVTYIFTHRFLKDDRRTVDQMVQAARSGKQNIAEGSAAGTTSKETEIKLTNVAKASLQELLIDYEDYLRVRGLRIWQKDEDIAVKTRNFCIKHNDSAIYREKVSVRSDETVANIAIILIHQADVMLHRLIERQKSDFLHHGGIREQMSQARRDYRSSQRSQTPPLPPHAPSTPSTPLPPSTPHTPTPPPAPIPLSTPRTPSTPIPPLFTKIKESCQNKKK